MNKYYKDNLTKPDYTKTHANFKQVFKLLFDGLDFSNDEAICLYLLGHPYYFNKLQKAYPKLKIFVIESEEVAKLYRGDLCYIVNITNDKNSFWPKELKDMKFDKIIMNPPYNGSLHLQILQEASQHSENTYSLQPAIWLKKNMINRPMAKWRNIFKGKIKNIEIIDHKMSNDLFGLGNSIEELGIFELSEKGNIDLEKFGFKNDTEYNLYKKIDISKAMTFNSNKVGEGGWARALCENAGKISEFRRPNDLAVYCWHSGKSCREAVIDKRENKSPGQVIYFKSSLEKENFIKSLDTKFMNWYYKEFIIPGDCKIINYMWRIPEEYLNPRTGLKGYESEWTDEDFYEFFGITDEEKKIIEETMKKYE